MAAATDRQRGRILAHPEDIHCVVFHLVAVAGYVAAFWVWHNREAAGINGPWSLAAFVVGASLLLGWTSGIDIGVNFHSHAHRRVFRKYWMNRWFGRLWTFTGGWPAYFWQYSHVIVHHANLLEEDDWTLPKRKANGEWENYYAYCLLHWPWRYGWHLYRDFRDGRGGHTVRRRAVKELAIFLVLWSIPFWIDPVMALCLWVLPHWLANVLVLAPGMIAQHAGCERPGEGHRFRHSNTYLSRLFNLTMFNIGYHSAHHTYPHVHWSELPELHERLKQELIDEGAHVMPFGYHRGGMLLAAEARGSKRARDTFDQQVPEYVGSNTPR